MSIGGYYMGRHVEREILSALIDGELSADERRIVHEHLQECSACRETVEEFGQIHGLMGELPRLVAPESFIAEVLEPINRPSPVARKLSLSRRSRIVAAAVAVAAAVITLAGLVVPPPAEEPPVDAYIDRHVTIHADVEAGPQVLFAVNGEDE